MAKEGSNAFYRAYADRWYLDRANRDTYLARQAPGDIILSGHLYLATKLLKGLDTPGADGDAARKKYVDDLIALYLPLAGGALTGDVTMAAGKTIDGMDPSAHLTAIDAHVAELLATLLGGANFFHIPTNAGWTEVKTGSGTTTQGTFYNQVRTVATVSSSALLNCLLLGLGQDAAIYIRITWDKKLYLVFNYIRATPDTEAVGRLQLKETNAIGALAAKGIGIKVLDMAIWGESYSTELCEVD